MMLLILLLSLLILFIGDIFGSDNIGGINVEDVSSPTKLYTEVSANDEETKSFEIKQKENFVIINDIIVVIIIIISIINW